MEMDVLQPDPSEGEMDVVVVRRDAERVMDVDATVGSSSK
jgi:hypothetical protein